MAKLIKTWEELDGLESENYIIRVKNDCCAWIRPKVETEDKILGKNCAYLNTHTFYGSQYKWSTELLQKFGFDVEIDNWDKGA